MTTLHAQVADFEVWQQEFHRRVKRRKAWRTARRIAMAVIVAGVAGIVIWGAL